VRLFEKSLAQIINAREQVHVKSFEKQADERRHGVLARPVPLQLAEQLRDADELSAGLLNAAQGRQMGINRSAASAFCLVR
jgi:hypothetical protein